jgi:NADPH2:quinone reductase
VVDVPVPKAAKGEVLVQMTMAAVSPLDNTIRAGHLARSLHQPPPLVPGASGIGVVVDVNGHADMKAGDRVAVGGGGLGQRRDGTWREYVAVPPHALLAIPDAVSDLDACALFAGAGHLTGYPGAWRHLELARTARAMVRSRCANLARCGGSSSPSLCRWCSLRS